MRFLIDTDIASYAIRGSQKVIRKLQLHQGAIGISAITRYELERGATLSPKHSTLIGAFLEALPCLAFDAAAARLAGQLHAALSDSGRSIATADSMIAGVAMSNNLTLVSNNRKHFAGIAGLEMTNWAE